MIDEKKLIEFIKSNDFKRRIIQSKDSLQDTLIQFITEQSTAGEWIPCSERIPEKTGYYLVQLSRKLPNEDYSDRVVVLYNGEDKEFMTYKRLITAWQPLPEPYQTEGGKS